MGQEFVLTPSGTPTGSVGYDAPIDAGPFDGSPANLRDDKDNAKILGELKIELAGYRAELEGLESIDPDQVMLKLSAIAGRLAGIRSVCWDMNTKAATNLRTRLVDPLREDLDFHFKCHSRRLAQWEWELRMSGGQT